MCQDIPKVKVGKSVGQDETINLTRDRETMTSLLTETSKTSLGRKGKQAPQKVLPKDSALRSTKTEPFDGETIKSGHYERLEMVQGEKLMSETLAKRVKEILAQQRASFQREEECASSVPTTISPTGRDSIPVQPPRWIQKKVKRKPRSKEKSFMSYLVAFIAVVAITVFLLAVVLLVRKSIYNIAPSTITADELCQSKLGDCAVFADYEIDLFPSNCSSITCRFACFYPNRDLDTIDTEHPSYSKNSTTISAIDGLICGPYHTCLRGVCQLTSKIQQKFERDLNSVSRCIISMYDRTSAYCPSDGRCNDAGEFCRIKNRMGIGFEARCSHNGSSKCIIEKAMSCDLRKCLLEHSFSSVSKYLASFSDKCTLETKGSCSFVCPGGWRTLPDGAPCGSKGTGCCWRGTCYQLRGRRSMGLEKSLRNWSKIDSLSAFGNDTLTSGYRHNQDSTTSTTSSR